MINRTVSRLVLAKSETIVGIVLVLLLATIQPATCDLIVIKQTKEGQTSSPQVFRILAVEGDFTTSSMTSGQLLIGALLGFSNWDNSSTSISYIGLLSLYGQDEVMDECKPYWRGESTKANVEYEIRNFLASASPNETVIFYYCGEGSLHTRLILDEIIFPNELTSWLTLGGLPQANVCVILDSCYSGSWINDGKEPGGYLGPGRVVLCSSLSNQESWCWRTRAWTWFTGREETRYRNGTYSPLGVIGGLFAGNDTNGDGWISFMEDFEFAKPSVEQYSLQEDEYWSDLNCSMNPVAYNDLGFDLPFVKLPEELKADFTVNPTVPRVNETVTFNASTSEGTILNYTWIGDDNTTTVSTPIINHTYSSVGNYTVTLNVTNNGLWDTTSIDVTVTFRTDLDRDGFVNIVDIAKVAQAYLAEYNETDGMFWHDPPCEYCPHTSDADIDGNETINIVDIAKVAVDYGKTV